MEDLNDSMRLVDMLLPMVERSAAAKKSINLMEVSSCSAACICDYSLLHIHILFFYSSV